MHNCKTDGCSPENCYQRYRATTENPAPYDQWVREVSDYEND